jgi:undecaprenol kinase
MGPVIAFLRGFIYAGFGVLHVVRTQRNMRVHIAIGLAAAIVGLWLSLSATEWAIVSLAMGGVLTAEITNTVVESLVDLISPEHHPLAKAAKDVAAGAVLVIAIFATLTGLLIYAPKLLQLIVH